jgi:hypothetical protein
MVPAVRRVAIIACIHAIVTLGLLAYCMDMSAVDGFKPPQSTRVAATAAHGLMLPGYLLWTSWASKNLPNSLEWLLFIANSGLWGFVISAAVRRE